MLFICWQDSARPLHVDIAVELNMSLIFSKTIDLKLFYFKNTKCQMVGFDDA